MPQDGILFMKVMFGMCALLALEVFCIGKLPRLIQWSAKIIYDKLKR